MSIGYKHCGHKKLFLFTAPYQIFRFGISIERIIFEVESKKEDESVAAVQMSSIEYFVQQITGMEQLRLFRVKLKIVVFTHQ